MAMIRGYLEIIEDQLQKIFEIQFEIFDKEWINSIRKLEEGYDLVLKYVKTQIEE